MDDGRYTVYHLYSDAIPFFNIREGYGLMVPASCNFGVGADDEFIDFAFPGFYCQFIACGINGLDGPVQAGFLYSLFFACRRLGRGNGLRLSRLWLR